MEDLISRRAAIDVVMECYDNNELFEVYEDRLNNLPSAQPRTEIIQCKDCKFYKEYKYVNGKPKYLPVCGFHAIYPKPDDFCSAAERREDG